MDERGIIRDEPRCWFGVLVSDQNSCISDLLVFINTVVQYLDLKSVEVALIDLRPEYVFPAVGRVFVTEAA